MDLLGEVQQYLADEADAQRFAWEGREFLDKDERLLREPWRAWGQMPYAEEGQIEGVKIGGFHDEIPLSYQAAWDEYNKKHIKDNSSTSLQNTSIAVQVDPVSGDVTLISARNHMPSLCITKAGLSTILCNHLSIS